MTWQAIGDAGTTVGAIVPLAINLRDQVNGAYETLIRIEMAPDPGSPGSVALTGLTITTLTQVNAKALPRLNIGRNQVYIGEGDQSDSMVLWPDLRGTLWMKDVYDSSNIAAQAVNVPRKYLAVVYPSTLNQDATLRSRWMRPITSRAWSMARACKLPRRVVHRFPALLRQWRDMGSVLSSERHEQAVRRHPLRDSRERAAWRQDRAVQGPDSQHIDRRCVQRERPERRTNGGRLCAQSGRRTANRRDAPLEGSPGHRSLVERSFRQNVTTFPTTVTIDVGGSDHPIMESLKVNVEDPSDPTPAGYSDGLDVGESGSFRRNGPKARTSR